MPPKDVYLIAKSENQDETSCNHVVLKVNLLGFKYYLAGYIFEDKNKPLVIFG